jgi:hypothetical protein
MDFCALNMWKHLGKFLLFLIIFGCVEPYSFVIHNETKTLVVEGYISDKSFNETLLYPSDGRYFSVRLSYSGDVTNGRPVMIPGASVVLKNDLGEEWAYTESNKEPGVYLLLNDDFEAVGGVNYKLRILPPADEVYESEWETLPMTVTPSIGEISFYENEIQKYKIQAGEKIIETVKGVTARINVPQNKSGDQIFYRWNYTPMWIFSAALTFEMNPVHRCWVTSKLYLPNYSLQVDNTGGYVKDLFFIETINERIFEDFSVLITQYASSERNYTFWREMQEQIQSGTVKDSPPYNLLTNLKSADGTKPVSGYFGVLQEQTRRWYFNSLDLSYSVTNDLHSSCLADPKIIPPSCYDCREYPFGTASNKAPGWWRK